MDRRGLNHYGRRCGHTGRRASETELRIRRAAGQGTVRALAAENGEDRLRRAATTIIENVRQFGTKAGRIVEGVGVGHVEVEVVGAADKTASDADWMPTAEAYIWKLR